MASPSEISRASREAEQQIPAVTEQWIQDFKDSLLRASANSSLQTPGKNLSEEDIAKVIEYLAQRLRVLEFNGNRILFIDEDHSEKAKKKLHIALQKIVERPELKTIFIEYFAPEIKKNAREFTQHTHIPLNFFLGSKERRSRIFSSNQLILKAEQEGKTIAVVDIANSVRYMINKKIMTALGPAVGIGYLLSNPEHGVSAPSGLSLFLAYCSFRSLSEVIPQHHSGKGFLSKIVDSSTFALEDARRHFISDAVTTRMTQEQPSSENTNPTEMLVIYPQFHNNRIIHNILYPNKLKKNLYQTFFPFLDYHLRLYSTVPSKDSTEKQFEKRDRRWKLIDKIPFNNDHHPRTKN